MKEELDVFNRIAQALLEDEQKEPVLTPIPIEEVYNRLDLRLEENGIDEKRFEKALKDLVLNTPRTTTNHFFNQLFGGRNGKATLGELLVVLLNNSMYTYKVGGPMIAMEKELIRNIGLLAGYGENAFGTIATGGSMTNYMAMIMARDQYDLNIRLDGVKRDLVMYTSQECHYSIKKNAAFGGIGRSNVRYIATNEKGEMLVEALEQQIQKDKAEGKAPFFINATIGTTVLGAIDPLRDIAEVAKRHGIWLHADAAFYGSFIFSKKNNHLADALELTDSFSMNAHKMLSTPITCSFILAKNKKAFYDSFNSDADYLFQGNGDDWNPGKVSFQCGRRNDALKFWCLWKSVGTSGLGRMVDNEIYLANTARDYIRNHPDYTLHNFDDSITVCFNYKGIPADKLCDALYESKELMVGYGRFREVEFVRFVTVNSSNTKEDILHFFTTLEKIASRIEI
ncbi:MAG: aminotransferase class V-fold PLP-dependent enzyme [Saprospiraceae bacterium]|nr:aminotransferase class V-fold PLP-dependent enzyme [Saprospiraceae bacterium]